MYQGKHCKRSRRRSEKSVALLVSLLLIIGVAVGGTIAFLVDSKGPINNEFTPSQVTTKVVEDITSDPTKKQDVKIQNTGDTDAWIRAAVVVTWQDEAGYVYGKMPNTDPDCKHGVNCSCDYTIEYDLNNGWVKGADGFYYWSNPVEAGKNTGILITEAQPVEGKAPEGYYLCIEILGSGIQSQPAEAVESAWPAVQVSTDDATKGQLVPATNG